MFLTIWRKLIYVNYLPISSDCFFSNHCCMLCRFPILFLVSFHSFRKDIHELVLLKQKEGDHCEI